MTNLASNLPLVATIIYFTIVALLSFLAIHRFVVARASWRHPWRESGPALLERGSLPRVLLQLPLYNEAQVVGRLIDTAAKLSYPRDRLTIQVLDDSTDETVGIAAEHVRRAREAGVDIHHIRRPNREGFKAGALAYGMELNDAPYIAILDADFLPQPDFIEQLVSDFRDHRVGAVQARWGHLNREDSFLTLGQGALLDGHFINEHGGRFARDTFFNFNGTAGIWRRACIEDAGGWSGRTLTEDLDLSYRAQIKGWRFVFRPDVLVPAELPDDVNSFKVQQHRWAKGSIETALYVLPSLLTSKMVTFRQKYEAMAHLLGNFSYPLVILMGLLLPWVVQYRIMIPYAGLVDSLLFLSGPVILYYLYGKATILAGAPTKAWRSGLVALVLGTGLAINNTGALFEALMRRRTAFIRTPKKGESTTSSIKGILPQFSVQACIELVLGLWILASGWLVLEHGRPAALPLIALFSLGFLVLGFGSVYNSWRSYISTPATRAQQVSSGEQPG